MTSEFKKSESTKSEPVKSTITNEQLNRLSLELSELEDRMGKLDKFVNSSRYTNLDGLTKDELFIQLSAMKIYHRVLKSRYERLISSNDNVPLGMD